MTEKDRATARLILKGAGIILAAAILASLAAGLLRSTAAPAAVEAVAETVTETVTEIQFVEVEVPVEVEVEVPVEAAATAACLRLANSLSDVLVAIDTISASEARTLEVSGLAKGAIVMQDGPQIALYQRDMRAIGSDLLESYRTISVWKVNSEKMIDDCEASR